MIAPQQILLIDDDIELCALLTEYLTDEGMHLDTCHDGNNGYDQVIAGHYELVILDVMLPGCNGFEVLKKIRRQSNVPVLMLTARGDEIDRIVGLEIGADDYLAKPFNPRELVARIRAILRRTLTESHEAPNAPQDVNLRIGDIELESNSRRVLQDGREVDLTTVEFNLLKTLLLSAGRVVSRDALNAAVLGREYSPDDRSIDVHISKLRKKLGKKIDQIERIKAIRGEGYLYAYPQE